MSDTLMELIKAAVPKEVLGKMGGMLGQPADKTSSAFETAAGAILGGLIKKATAPGGADEIFNTARKQDGSILGNLGDIFGGGQATQDLEKKGGGILDVIFGSNNAAVGGMTAVLAKYLKLDEKMVAMVLKMAAPIVMGVIAKYMKQKSLDAAGLGNFLGAQKESLAAVMPASLTSQLGFSDLLGKTADAARNMGNTTAATGRAMAGTATDAANSGGSLLKMLIPLIVIGLLGWLAYTYLLKPAGDAGDAAGKIGKGIEAGAAAVGDTDFGDFDMSGLTAQFGGITNGLKDVSTENADGLADKISGLTKSLEGMGFDKLAGPAKTAVGSAIDGFKKSVETAMNNISNDAIRAILKPVVDALMEKIKSLGF